MILLPPKGSKHSLRLLFFAAFWSAKSGAKIDPPTKKAERGGLTLAPGDYSRVCKQTVPSARAFSPHLSERLFCQAGVVRRGTWREGCVRNKQEAQKPTIAPGSGFKPPHYRSERKKEHSPARVPGAGGCKGLILLRPLNAGRRRLPRRTTCGWFWCYLLPSKGSYTPRGKTVILPFAVGIRKRSRSAKINGPTVARNVFFATFVLTIRLRADCLLCFT